MAGQSNAANRFWVAATPSNWNNTANWSGSSGGAGGASVPGAADAVTFNNLGTGNCTLDVAVSVMSITVTAGYTGNISQGANTFSTAKNASFSGGTFSGGSADITIGKNFTLGGTAFISTTAVLEFDGNSAFTSGSFIPNNGTVRYNASGATKDGAVWDLDSKKIKLSPHVNHTVTISGVVLETFDKAHPRKVVVNDNRKGILSVGKLTMVSTMCEQ